MSLPVEVSGVPGTWRAVSGEVATLELAKAFAPGAPIQIQGILGDAPISVSAKTVASKRRGELFEVRARLIGLTRGDRSRIAAHFAPPPA